MSRISVKCINCGREFYSCDKRVKEGRGKYCSKKCMYSCSKFRANQAEKTRISWIGKPSRHTPESKEKQSLKLRGRKLPEHQIILIKERMKGNQYGKGKVGYWKGKLMPYEIRMKMRASAPKGENHPMWKGGKRGLKRLIRDCSKYRTWRNFIFYRDNYICQKCGRRGGTLDVDHFPEEFSKILDAHEIKTLNEALECFALWDVNNGRTLCRKCHLSHTFRKH